MKKSLRHHIAKYCPWFLQSIAYNLLYRILGASYTLNPADFTDKRVLIVGPAASVGDDLKVLNADAFDIIVKMNNGLYTELDLGENNPLRCDVLFHSYRGDTKPITTAALQRANVKIIVHRTMKRRGFLSTLELESTFGFLTKIRIIPVCKYNEIRNRIGKSPTTGLICVDFFLTAPVNTLAIVGFTFFTTRYVGGYNDAIKTDAIARSRMDQINYHAPRLEARLMQELINESRSMGKSVIVSDSMQKAMDARQHEDM